MLKKSSRIEILRKTADNELRISIKAGKFLLGNAILTLCLAVMVLGGVLVGYLMFDRPGNFPLLIPAFTALAIAMVARIWLWYCFGEELIEVKGNCLYVKRSYGLFTSKEKYFPLDGSIDLYVNKTDNWSWKNFKEKGVFRLAKDTETLDFGIKLDNNEYEMLLSQINKLLNRYKMTPVQPPPVASEELLPLPSLAVQLKGQHLEKLKTFYNKNQNKPAVTSQKPAADSSQ